MKYLADFLRSIALLAIPLLAAIGVNAARADSYPTQPIRIIVGFEPGGNTDVPARLFGNVISRNLGVPVIVENKPGASGVPAAQYVKLSKPDGYTLLWATSASHSVAVVVMAPLPFDPIKDFTPITLISMDPNVIMATPAFPADSPQGLLDYLRAHPRTPVGTIGPATSGRFALELLKAKLGIETVFVPYKTTGTMLTDLAGGQIPLGIMAESTALPFIQDKRVKPLVMTSLKRSTALPNVATIDETESKGFDAVAWSALYAPPKTPEPIVARINAAMKDAAQAPEVKKWLDASGLVVPLGSPEELTGFMQADIDKWVKLAKDNHLSFNSGQ